MAKVLQVDDVSFEQEVTRSEVPVLVDFSATWCPPCKMIAPIVEELAQQAGSAFKVVKLDVDEAPAVAARLGIRGMPTFVAFRAGREVARHVGANTTKAWLRAMVSTE